MAVRGQSGVAVSPGRAPYSGGHRTPKATALYWPTLSLRSLASSTPRSRRHGGCHAALHLLAALQPRSRHARVVGDNLAVIRYGAGTARLRRPAMQGLIGPTLSRLESTGWVLDWRAVRRRLNSAADTVATTGVFDAARLAEAGGLEPTLHTTWH